jgi:hypothetical protein
MAQQERYRRDFRGGAEHLPGAERRGAGHQARRARALAARTHTTWYLEEQADVDRAVHWVIGLPGVFLNTAGDLSLLPRVLDAASGFERRPSDAEIAAMLDSTRMTSLLGFPPDPSEIHSGRVGVREPRRKLSVCLRRVAGGES